MPRVWISIGSNLDRERNIRAAVDALRAEFGELILSSVYATPAHGFDGPPFYNLVAGIETDLPVGELHRKMAEIEDASGRQRDGGRFANRTLDLDVLTYGDAVTDEGGKHLPRCDILEYDFVLAPLAEVAPDERHPELGDSYGELWRQRGGSTPVVVSGLAG